jgi:hypothetical protein
MTAVQDPEILLVLERGWEIKQVDGLHQCFYRIVEISGFFCIGKDYQVIQAGRSGMPENGGKNKGGRASMQVAEIKVPGLGQQEVIRNPVDAGIIHVFFQQSLQVHTLKDGHFPGLRGSRATPGRGAKITVNFLDSFA